MTVFMVNYDLMAPGQRYNDLIEEIEKSPGWCKLLLSCYLVSTSETATQLRDRLRTRIDANDLILVMEVRNNAQGWLPQAKWDWINKHVLP